MVYHIYNKSIANFVIFNNADEYTRMVLSMRYYQLNKRNVSFSRFIRPPKQFNYGNVIIPMEQKKFVKIIAYCIMPTHLHLILDDPEDAKVSVFMNNILNSYTRYFNIKHNRKGPLWESRYKRVFMKNDGQLLHLTRYIHLNPTTAYLVNNPIDWPYSSYREYLNPECGEKFCDYVNLLDIEPDSYKKFVEDRILYQRELSKVKTSGIY